MASPAQIQTQINKLISYLVETGLADDQKFAFRRAAKAQTVQITFEGAEHVSVALRDRDYDEIYLGLVKRRAYNVKMLDGALIQMMYKFTGSNLQRHRLAFFPAPNLEKFQNAPQIYLEDEIYGDVVSGNIVPFPLRFDYGAEEDRYEELTHPKSHLSLGQYNNCRIPVTSPVAPGRFVDFILRNFYDTKTNQYVNELPSYDCSFESSISPAERGIIHVVIPS